MNRSTQAKSKRIRRVKANALLFSIIVSLVISICLSAFFLTAFYFAFLSSQNKRLEQLERNLFSGTQLFLTSLNKDIPYEKITNKSTPENENGILSYYRKAWGIYDIGIIKSIIGTDTLQRILLASKKNDSIMKSALYIADEGRPILFAGKTIVDGDCYLPLSGIKRAYIDGNYFTEKKLIKGDTLKSNKKVPPLDVERMEILNKMSKLEFWIKSGEVELAKELPFEITERSFSKHTLIFYSKQPLVLRRKNLSGNIVIISDTLIELQEDNYLKDVIIIAKKILISSSTHGNFQAFVSDTLWVEPNTKIDYPSVLGVFANGKDNKAMLKVEKGCSIYGTLFLQIKATERSQALIQTDETSIINGKIHSDNYAEIRGTLNGNLTCQKTVVHTPSATYDNHLYNVNIIPKSLSKYFIQGMLYPESKKGYSLVKYLD